MAENDEDFEEAMSEEKAPREERRVQIFSLPGRQGIRLNLDLVPMKLIYFFFFGGYAFMLPFLPVFYRYIGISAKQTGIILGLRTVAQFLGAPLWGAVADKSRRHKLVMLVGMVLSMSLLFSTVFITPPSKAKEVEMNCCFACDSKSNINISSREISKDLLVMKYGSSPVTFLTPLDEEILSIRSKQRNLCLKNDTANTIEHSLFVEMKVDSNHFISLDNERSNYSGCELLRNQGNFSMNFTTASCKRHWNLINGQLGTCINITNTTQFLFCRNGDEVNTSYDNSNKFILLFSLTLLGSFFMTFESGMADASVTKYMEKTGRPGDYGKQRIWGGIGWAICSVFAGLANDASGKTSHGSKYLISFCSYLGLTILAMLCVCKLHMSHLGGAKQPAIFKSLATIFVNFQIIAFLLAELVMGICNAFIQMYLFLFLEDLGATNLLMGLSLFVTTCAENPLMFASGYVIKKLGHNGVFYLVFLAYTLRFLCYSFLENVWYVLPIELFHGITYGLMWPATTSYVGIAAPPGMAATLQGIVTAIHWALGAFLAGLAGGPLYTKHGARKVFRGLSLLAVTGGVTYALSLYSHKLISGKSPSPPEELEEMTISVKRPNQENELEELNKEMPEEDN